MCLARSSSQLPITTTMQIIEEYISTARDSYSLGNYEEAVPACKLALSKLNGFMSSIQNDEVLLHYLLEAQEELTEALSFIENSLIDVSQAVQLFESELEDDARESPPVDPQNASFVRPNRIHPPPNMNLRDFGRAKKNTVEGNANGNGSRKSRISSINSNQDANQSTSSVRGAANNVRSSYGKVDDQKGSPASHDDTPAELKAYDSELVTLIQNGILQETPSISFDRVAGLAEAKELLHEAIVWPVEHPEWFKGIRRPWRGICMFGPPGTGKTMLAKAVACQCHTTFFNVSSAVLTSKYRGDSEKLVKILFDVARARAPSTIFIDEIDSICSRRGTDSEHEASRRAKSELLIQMDGLSSGPDDKLVVVLAATNFPWDLDDALIRRLEKRIYIPLPDFPARLSLLETLLSEGVQVSENVCLEDVAQKLDGYSGSDISSICRDAAMAPMREFYHRNKMESADTTSNHSFDIDLDKAPDLTIRMEHFDAAIQNIMPSVSREKLDQYANWMKDYGSK